MTGAFRVPPVASGQTAVRAAYAGPVTHVRWLVDGMNVIGARPDGWWRNRPAAMESLVDRLAAFASETNDSVAVVFDAGPVVERTGVEVALAPHPGRDAADDEIARRVAADADPGSLRVVTSDGALAARVRAAGAVVVGSGQFRRRLERETG